jgi:ribosome-associated translation inhibitor RaiA
MVHAMAYLRKQKETFEIDYPLPKIWKAIPKALASLEWTVNDIDNLAHHVKAKTKAGFMAYSSVLLIDAVPVSKKSARVTVTAETPVTTITSIADFGRTLHRIDLFFEALAKQLSNHKNTG